MTKPIVSVVVTCFNQRKFIRETVESVLSQTYDKLQLIVIDDGSSDGTSTVVSDIRDPRLIYVWQENAGPSDATNAGIERAEGEYIALLGGDDVCLSNRLEQQLEQIERGYDVIFSLPKLIDESSAEIPYFRSPVFYRDRFDTEAELYSVLFRNGNFICGPSALMRRDFFSKFGLFKRGLIQLQDFELWIRSCKRGARMHLFDDPVIKYRVRNKSENLSSIKNAARTQIELDFVYREFFADVPHELLQEAFPHEISEASANDPASRDADTLFLYLNHKFPNCRRLGVEKAIAYLEDGPRSQELARRGFGPPELFELMRTFSRSEG